MSQHSAVHGTTGKQSAGWGAEALKNGLGWHLEVPISLQPLMAVRSLPLNIFPVNILSQPGMTED